MSGIGGIGGSPRMQIQPPAVKDSNSSSMEETNESMAEKVKEQSTKVNTATPPSSPESGVGTTINIVA